MAVRIIYLILAIALMVNLVLTFVSLIMGVNLYQKYGKQILNFFIGLALFIIAVFIVFAFMGLI